MTPTASQIFGAAVRHLSEAQTIGPDQAPGAAVHSAYYAMFHAARAVLFEAHGTVSMKHGTVHSAFETLAATGTPDAQKQARSLRAAYQARLETDYTTTITGPEEAAKLLALAAEFVAYCARRLGKTELPPTARP